MPGINVFDSQLERWMDVLGDALEAANRGGTDEQQEALSELSSFLHKLYKEGSKKRGVNVAVQYDVLRGE